MLALKRTWFLLVIGAVAIAEPILLLNASRKPANFAAVVLAVQAVGALVAFAVALRRDSARPVPLDPPPAGVAGTTNGSAPSREVLSDALSRSAQAPEVGSTAQR